MTGIRFSKKLTVGIFLRDDIYGVLRFEDKNKTTENFSAKGDLRPLLSPTRTYIGIRFLMKITK